MEIRESNGGYFYINPQEEEKTMEEYGQSLKVLRENASMEDYEKDFLSVKGMKVLIVEENISWQKLISTYLRTLEVKSISVQTGEDAVKYMKETNCDLILLDQIMPDMEGTTVIEKMCKKLLGKKPLPPIVMMVSYEMPDLQEILEKYNIADYMIKPVDIKQIKRVILNCKKEQDSQTGE